MKNFLYTIRKSCESIYSKTSVMLYHNLNILNPPYAFTIGKNSVPKPLILLGNLTRKPLITRLPDQLPVNYFVQ